MAGLFGFIKNAAARKRITDQMPTKTRSEFETALGTTQAKAGGTGSFSGGGLFGTGPPAASSQAKAGPLGDPKVAASDSQKKKRRGALGAPTNIGKKRLLGG